MGFIDFKGENENMVKNIFEEKDINYDDVKAFFDRIKSMNMMYLCSKFPLVYRNIFDLYKNIDFSENELYVFQHYYFYDNSLEQISKYLHYSVVWVKKVKEASLHKILDYCNFSIK